MQPERTYLFLESFRRLLGLSVLDFYGVSLNYCGRLTPSGCSDLWVRDNSQAEDNQLSWTSLIVAIQDAERDIMNYLGHPLGLDWVCDTLPWPEGSNYHATFDLGGHFVQGGQRAESLLATATKGVELTFTDTDGDGFPETATIVITDPAFEGVDPCEIEFRYNGYFISYATIDITSDTLTATFLSFQLLNPSLFDGLFTSYPIELCCPTDGGDCDVLDNFVDTVSVYRVYNDCTAKNAEICTLSNPYDNCQPCNDTPCTPSCVDGCITQISKNGIVRVSPATPDGSCGWLPITTCSLLCPPTFVNLYYQINPCKQFSCNENNCWRLCPEYAKAIVALASARLKKSCVCKCAESQIIWYQRELGENSTSITYASDAVTFASIEQSPFGTLWGEMYAYQMLRGLIQNKVRLVSI